MMAYQSQHMVILGDNSQSFGVFGSRQVDRWINIVFFNLYSWVDPRLQAQNLRRCPGDPKAGDFYTDELAMAAGAEAPEAAVKGDEKSGASAPEMEVEVVGLEGLPGAASGQVPNISISIHYSVV